MGIISGQAQVALRLLLAAFKFWFHVLFFSDIVFDYFVIILFLGVYSGYQTLA